MKSWHNIDASEWSEWAERNHYNNYFLGFFCGRPSLFCCGYIKIVFVMVGIWLWLYISQRLIEIPWLKWPLDKSSSSMISSLNQFLSSSKIHESVITFNIYHLVTILLPWYIQEKHYQSNTFSLIHFLNRFCIFFAINVIYVDVK